MVYVHKKSSAILIAIAVACYANTPVDLDTLTVTASKREEVRAEVPSTVKTVTKKEIEFFNPQNSGDLLTINDGVYNQKSQQAGGSPMIRGFNANRILITVDGVRMNNLIYRAGNLQNVLSVDPNMLETAQVIYGPSSVIYGSDAMGGVMSFTSKSPQLGDSVRFAPSGMFRYSTANSEKTVSGSAEISGKRIGNRFGVSASQFGELTMGKNGDFYQFYNRDHFQEMQTRPDGTKFDTTLVNPDPSQLIGTAYNQLNLNNVFLFKPTPTVTLKNSTIFSTTSDAPRSDRLFAYKHDSTLANAEWYYGPQQWFMNALSANIVSDNSLFTAMNITGSYQNYTESRHDRKMGKSELRHQVEKVNVFALNLDLDRHFSDKQTLFYGIELLGNTLESTAWNENIFTGDTAVTRARYPMGDNLYGAGGVYVQVKSNWSDKITTVGGARFSYSYLNSEFGKTRELFDSPLPENLKFKSGTVTGTAGVSYHPSEKITLRTNFSSGYRAPNVDDAGKFFDQEGDVLRVPSSADISPEKSFNADLGIDLKPIKTLTFETTGFITRAVDFLAVAPATLANGESTVITGSDTLSVYAMQNYDGARIWGGTGSVEWNFVSPLTFKSSITAIQGLTQGGETDLPQTTVPPIFGSTHLLFEGKKITADAYANYNFRKDLGTGPADMTADDPERPNLPLDESGTPHLPGWVTFNLKGSVTVFPFLTIDAGIENIGDLAYRSFRSDIPGMGRNFYAAIRVKR